MQIVPVFLTDSSGLMVHKTSISHLIGIFYHFSLDKDFSSSITAFLPSKLLNILSSVSVLCQLFWNSATGNL